MNTHTYIHYVHMLIILSLKTKEGKGGDGEEGKEVREGRGGVSMNIQTSRLPPLLEALVYIIQYTLYTYTCLRDMHLMYI